MAAIPDKFQAVIVRKNSKIKETYPLNNNDLTINSENSVKPFVIKINKKLPFEQRISTLCNNASNQLNENSNQITTHRLG